MDETPRRILLVEDDEHDVELMTLAFAESGLANEIDVARDGEVALDYVHARGEWADRDPRPPLLILLDIKMPKVDGLEVLRKLRATPSFRRVPVVMLTSSVEERDVVESYELGVNAYVRKPLSFDDFSDAVRKIGLFWLLVNEPPPVEGWTEDR